MPNDWVRPPFQGALASATLAINERSADLVRQGREVFRFGLGQSPFPVPEEVVEALRRHAGEKDYLPVQGLGALREAVAGHHRRLDGLAGRADDIVVGPGSKELLFLLQLVLEAELLVPTPCWVTYPPQNRMVGRQPTLIRTRLEDGWLLDPEALEAVVTASDRRSLLILNYPNNPTGQIYRDAELAAIAEVARAHDVLVFSDEIYGRLDYAGAHRSLASHYPEGTIVGSGLSKWCGAGGWRLGTFLFPHQQAGLKDAVVAAASETFTSVSAPVQYAAIDAFDGSPAIDDYLAHSRRLLAALADALVEELTVTGLTVLPPQGAFYALVGFEDGREALAARSIRTSTELAEAILEETGVAFLPGEPFGMRDEQLWVRLAFVDFDGAAALEASRLVPSTEPLPAPFLERHCARTLEAARRISSWYQEACASLLVGGELEQR